MQAPWLDEMRSRIGIQEIRGARHNAVIVGWFHEIGHAEVHDDETSWCAVAIGSCLKRSGLPTTPVTVNMLARSYLTYGVACEPKPGAIAVWPRGNSTWQGHVNIVDEVRVANGRTEVRCIGGNQGGLKGGDAVTRTGWQDAGRALGFRWPVAATVPDLRAAGSSEIRDADTIETISVALPVASTAATAVKAVVEKAPDLTPEAAAQKISTWNGLLEGINGLGSTVAASPWLVAVVGGGVAAFFIARRWKRNRVRRHDAGAPIAAQMAAPHPVAHELSAPALATG